MAADLRSRSKIVFLHLKHLHLSFALQYAFNRRWYWPGVYVSPCSLALVGNERLVLFNKSIK